MSKNKKQDNAIEEIKHLYGFVDGLGIETKLVNAATRESIEIDGAALKAGIKAGLCMAAGVVSVGKELSEKACRSLIMDGIKDAAEMYLADHLAQQAEGSSDGR